MPLAPAIREIVWNWTCPPQICFFASRTDVSWSSLSAYIYPYGSDSPEIFDEYTRRQYLAKAPARNPFGDDEEAKKFAEFDVFTKLRVLVQLSQWTLINAERMRERMPEVKDSEQIQWVCTNTGLAKEMLSKLSYCSGLKKSVTTNKNDSTLYSTTTGFTAAQTLRHRLRHCLNRKPTQRRGRPLLEPASGERL